MPLSRLSVGQNRRLVVPQDGFAEGALTEAFDSALLLRIRRGSGLANARCAGPRYCWAGRAFAAFAALAFIAVFCFLSLFF